MSYFTLLFSYQSFLKCSDLANQRAINPGLAEKKLFQDIEYIYSSCSAKIDRFITENRPKW